MPEPQQIKKAYLQEVEWGKNGQAKPKGDQFYVQFNPQSLKVNYSNQKSNNDQKGGAAIQFVGKGTTKLSVELFFDVTGGTANNSTTSDVRDLTKRVAKFIEPRSEGGGIAERKSLSRPAFAFTGGASSSTVSSIRSMPNDTRCRIDSPRPIAQPYAIVLGSNRRAVAASSSGPGSRSHMSC